jgi:hypothetical protein
MITGSRAPEELSLSHSDYAMELGKRSNLFEPLPANFEIPETFI